MELSNEIESPDGNLLYFPWFLADAHFKALAVGRSGVAPQSLP
jgi:hypothetical protein